MFTEADLIPTATSSSELADILNETFWQNGYYVDPADLAQAGVPVNGTENILRTLYTKLVES